MQLQTKVIISLMLGSAIELFDFTIFAVMSPIIGKLFFPTQDQIVSIIMGFSAFSVGFMARPVGGIIFGHIGDTKGRKISLLASVIGISLFTFLIGLIPTYEQIGTTATILLLLLRFMQGVCLGGEFTGASIFAYENFLTKQKSNFTICLILIGSIAGAQLAIILGTFILEYNLDNQLIWRIPFILSGTFGFISIYMRMFIKESLPQGVAQTNSIPLRVLINNYKMKIFKITLICGFVSSITYTMAIYTKIFLADILKIDQIHTMIFVSIGILSFCLSCLLLSYFLNKADQNKPLVYAANLAPLFIITFFIMISTKNYILICIA
jgi:MHS family proline/betaine transporter-like MFS transporter